MVLKLESDNCYSSISYWDYGIDESMDVWDDNIVNAYAGANFPHESKPKVKRIYLTLGGDNIHALRIISESLQQVKGYTVTIRYYSYMVIHKGYLLEFCFTGAPYDEDYTYYEKLLKGVTLK